MGTSVQPVASDTLRDEFRRFLASSEPVAPVPTLDDSTRAAFQQFLEADEAESGGLLAGLGDVAKSIPQFFVEAGRVAGRGYQQLGSRIMPRTIPEPSPEDVTSAARSGVELIRGAVTFPYEAGKGIGEVIASPGEFAGREREVGRRVGGGLLAIAPGIGEAVRARVRPAPATPRPAQAPASFPPTESIGITEFPGLEGLAERTPEGYQSLRGAGEPAAPRPRQHLRESLAGVAPERAAEILRAVEDEASRFPGLAQQAPEVRRSVVENALSRAFVEGTAPSPRVTLRPGEVARKGERLIEQLPTMGLSPEMTAALKGHAERAFEQAPASARGRVTVEQLRIAAQDIGLTPDDLTGPAAKRLNGVELLAIRNTVNDTFTRLTERLRELETATPEARPAIEATTHRMMADIDRLLGAHVQARAEAGRTLRFLRVVATRATRGLDPTAALAMARQLVGEQAFTKPGFRERLVQAIEKGDRVAVVQLMREAMQPTPWQSLVNKWKAGLLTNPVTHFVNVASTMTNGLMEAMKSYPGALVDRLIALHTGVRTRLPVGGARLRAMARGAGEGVREAREVLRTGVTPEEAARLEVGGTAGSLYEQVVFRLLNAEDRVFRTTAYRGALREQALLQARQEGLRGPARDARAAQIAATPTDIQVSQAIMDAEVATFRDVTRLSEAAGAVVRRIPALELIIPFRRTPSAVAARVFEYSPIGLARAAVALTKLLTKERPPAERLALQRQVADLFGRGVTGSGLMWLGYQLAERDLLTGVAPTNEADRNRWTVEGRQAGSMRVEGTWYQIMRLTPMAPALIIGASLHQLEQDTEATPGQRLGQWAALTSRTILDQPFVSGVDVALGALKEPERRGAQFVEQLAGSLVPAGVAATARAIDPTQREVSGPVEAIQGRVPGLSRALPPRRDVLGATVPRPGGLAQFSPTRPMEITRDPVAQELARIDAAIHTQRRRPGESVEAFRRRQAETGTRFHEQLDRLQHSGAYQRADDDLRRLLTRRLLDEVRDATARRAATEQRSAP